MKSKISYLSSFLLLFFCTLHVSAQKNKTNDTHQISNDTIFNGLKLRSIGPAFMSGRIAAIAIHPENENIWYVGVASGGVWKTVNSGTTWTPIFDDQSTFAIGAVTIDPNNHNIIWVGTGEDVGGRHISYGDGIYKSVDGGNTWENMGLEDSQHISKIIVHPEDSNTIWVAAQGPLWNKGGDRGLYKSVDGGKSWKKTLGNSEWTGVTEVVIDLKNPNILVAATWDRHRTVAAYMGGGPGSGLHKSTDAGETWIKLTNGLPKGNMGKIGLAMSHFNSNILYAAIEMERRTGGLWRSDDGGNSWKKQSNTVTGGTGPHYYQELYSSPHQEEKLYLMDNNLQISEDGGKTFYRMNEKNKHGDNHAIAFKQNDPDYLLVGSDGGLYESFDLTKTWKYIENLPITQFYKLAVDDAKPFYNIYGGTQDNSSESGPSRTDNIHGIQNSDWKVILNWDGHQTATEPGNPDIVYAERQEGTLSRIDMSTGEVIDIQPQPSANENYERFNWDAPILISPHSPTTIYFASQRVWKSVNRGDDWTPISGDLTKNQNRIELPIMGKKQSFNEAWDVYAMSNYNTITSLAESPKQQGLIYAGTDDGIIQVTQDDGNTWTKKLLSSIPGIPATAFVNDIRADLFDANTVYMALDNHKYGDFKPYMLKSTDKGETWSSISSNIPENTMVWRLVQDHIKKDLLFAATEFGIYFTINGGDHWAKLKGGVPTISFRDITIQRRENDLVGASFGRGFYILDDITPLRELSDSTFQKDAKLFSTRDAWWYIERPHLSFESGKGSQGDSHFVAPNPDFGAVLTYYLKEIPKTAKAKRIESEKKYKNSDVPFPGYDDLSAETLMDRPQLIFTIEDNTGNIIRKLTTTPRVGINRIAWDLRYPSLEPILLNEKKSQNNNEEVQRGLLAPPGNYKATMYLQNNGVITKLDETITFNVKPLFKGALQGSTTSVTADFWRSYETVSRDVSAFDIEIKKTLQRLNAMEKASIRTNVKPGSLEPQLKSIRDDLNKLNIDIYGNPAKLSIGEKTRPQLGERLFTIYRGIERSTYGPTNTHKKQLKIISAQLTEAKNRLIGIKNKMESIYTKLKLAGSPYVEK
ncbi:WD40/YVTN/BNR-like repeat-containing protein [Dokdonia sp. Hel_I_53]|uniref:WD40/YVTN/BNR-like repeat-containing protein n=1 Tax=Dokdonia sp. Hel_I_53 TaxID=1566287 RepID=UPI001199E44A|nr:glycosyl hydrolase [Dokdonia sp. Hel_I_53]TVZ51411.1 photosystem II stability/assembly factor-like uncharacterized protein [Dokdonia sp. Hel_I_53]